MIKILIFRCLCIQQLGYIKAKQSDKDVIKAKFKWEDENLKYKYKIYLKYSTSLKNY